MCLQDLVQEIPLVEKHLDDAAQNEITKTAERSDQEAHRGRGIEGPRSPLGNRRDELPDEPEPRREAEQREQNDVQPSQNYQEGRIRTEQTVGHGLTPVQLAERLATDPLPPS